jgi:nitroimidazol reductase NimA-like FMN-containing flavoprotein (pyridoxamine 5'-phosphate oxidase superfamily)
MSYAILRTHKGKKTEIKFGDDAVTVEIRSHDGTIRISLSDADPFNR